MIMPIFYTFLTSWEKRVVFFFLNPNSNLSQSSFRFKIKKKKIIAVNGEQNHIKIF